MRLKHIEISGFKSFAKKSTLSFTAPVTCVVGPNGSGKSNVVESFRFVLGEQSMKSMRGKSGADLIFKGGTNAPKLSRAAVSITFDNTDKVFNFNPTDENAKAPVLFEEITFTRELFADGTSRYLMNGTEIRLKQMVELLSSVNIGTSSHHIISQGEADGILRASARDRREMLEDALGLKVYHFRIKESENKLAKTTATLKEVQSLRRELAPHLNFLKKQVEKVEKGRAIREELEALLVQYLATERVLLQDEDNRLAQAHNLIANKKKQLDDMLLTLPEETVHDSTATERAEISEQLRIVREKRRTSESRISRLEGMVEAQRQMLMAQSKHQHHSNKAVAFAAEEYQQLLADIELLLRNLREAQSLEMAKSIVGRFESLVAKLKDREEKPFASAQDREPMMPLDTGIKDTALELEGFERELKAYIAQEDDLQARLQAAEQARDSAMLANQTSTRKRYEIISEVKQCEAELQILAVSKSAFIERKEYFDTELKEAGFLFGPSFLHTLQAASAIPEFDLHTQKRNIDRLKIRLDEHAGIGNEVVSEYESTIERDAFLAREVTDIESGIRNLETLIIDLKQILDEQFTNGVKVINERFGDFFKTMFGGGSAFLSITLEKKRKRRMTEEEEIEAAGEDAEETEEFERGIEVHVNLPEKKVKELNMLSGGERSLVSIALLFAISQVNPPPFLVLDETDAALDEANSRRYGDMIELLSQYSQLIVVTHNRETMSRASVLYGVTLGTDGDSKLLSIKFDEAVKVAK